MKNMRILLVSLFLTLPACNMEFGVNQPPLPTIVAVTPTFTPLPPTPTAMPTVETNSKETSGAENGETAATSEESSTGDAAETPAQEIAPTEIPGAPAPPPLDSIAVGLEPVFDGFTRPVYVTHAGDGSGRLFIVEQPGRISVAKEGVVNSTPFLDITPVVGSDSNEQGLLSVAFHPEFEMNGLFFVNYTNKQGDTVIARYNVTENPDVADANSEKILMTIGQPYPNHNGGHILFGPDSYLYIGLGDGGAANDPQDRAQNLGTLLGKILRIDIDNGDPYGVPPTNPFVENGQARPEIWSFGWRNPWRLAFDPETGDMYVADVGQNQYEEVHVELAGSGGGQNYGWRLMEGFHCFNPSQCDPASLEVALPVTEYDHNSGCSVTGGYVYRGTQVPKLAGAYIYGDYCSGIIWGIRREPDNSWSQAQLLSSNANISSFGQNEAGELYLVDHQGRVLHLVAK